MIVTNNDCLAGRYTDHCPNFFPDLYSIRSNFPVDKACCPYTTQWNAFKPVSSDYSLTERLALFHDTASFVFRLYFDCISMVVQRAVFTAMENSHPS